MSLEAIFSLESILVRCAAVVALAVPAVWAQNPGVAPAFEVAVIKPSLPMAEAMPLLMQGKLRAGISIDKARVDLEFVTLTDLIVAAYRLKPHQISGPDWLSMERFNIQAKLPDGAVEDRVPDMLQTLLGERFGLKAHTELRAMPAYALIAGKNGPKLKPSTLPADPDPGGGLQTMTPSAGGTMTSTGGPAGPTRITMGQNGGPNGIQLVLLRASTSGLADLLSSITGKPVVDRTGLNDRYEIALDIAVEDVQNVARALGMGGPAAAIGAATDPGGSSVFQAVGQLGLRLDPRKEEIKTLVIDKIDKQPTAN
ncbi:MAG TPA: TIGR03435 family protein [Bryobacteraceae bacterium]|jgi:uncharacterized protein (TIGR03435 family)|nr:TIGR03435 family protein [Bryobacteraceae bacterium]